MMLYQLTIIFNILYPQSTTYLFLWWTKKIWDLEIITFKIKSCFIRKITDRKWVIWSCLEGFCFDIKILSEFHKIRIVSNLLLSLGNFKNYYSMTFFIILLIEYTCKTSFKYYQKGLKTNHLLSELDRRLNMRQITIQ